MSVAHRTPKMSVRALVWDLAGNTFFIALNASFLAVYAPALTSLAPGETSNGNLICDSSVRTYLIGQLVLYCVYSLPQRPLQYYIENYNPELRRSRLITFIWGLWSALTLFDILWFFIGQYWVFSSNFCKDYDPPLYWLAVAQIIFFYVSTIIPIFLYAILVYLSRRRYLRAQQEGGTGPAAHLKGGLSKAELATLRTFVFKTNMAVAPEEDEEPNDLEIGNATRLTILETAQMHEDFSSHNDSDQPPLQTNSEPPNDKGKSPVYLNPETINDNEPSQAITEADLPSGAATNCAICFCDFESGDVIRELACLHIFHVDCIDPWLIIQGPASSKENGRPSPPKAHRTCPLCVREAILPEFRDKDVELAMELQKKEEEEMAKVLERLKKEAEEEQLLIERRRKREEERRKRRAKNGLGSLLGRGRSHTADPSNAVAPEFKPTRSSSYTGGAIAITAQPDNSSDSPQERVSTMKSKLQTIKSRLLESNEGSSESYAEAQKIEAIIDSVQSGLNAEHKDGNMEIGENSEKS